MSTNKWIQKSIKHPGALTERAKREHAVTEKGTIDPNWLAKEAGKGGIEGKRARLAQTLSKLNKK